MNERGSKKGRNTLLAVFLALAMPGLGQIYGGELIKGVSYFLILLAISLIGIRGTVLLPDSLMIFGALATMLACGALYILTVVDAFKKASAAEAAYQLKPYNRWYFYTAIWLLGRIVWGGVIDYSKENYIEAYRIPTASMEPSVRQGDCVLVDKTAYSRMAPKKGDIIIFVNPDDRSKRFIKRIEALPGETIAAADGTREEVPHGYVEALPGETIAAADGAQKEVPHGYVYVLGDNRAKSYDSRQFGFIPIRDIVGKVRQVYFSSGINGILWERIGVTIDSR